MPHATPQRPHRKSLAIKYHDGEPLTRADLQYDLLHHIFSNTLAAFTDPFPGLNDEPPGTKATFRDLYINCLVNSPRCSKASHDKILACPEFGNEFGKISLLSNVGRINTTMAFFPEMRTALRTYHPVPSLQKADGNLQDAPRIKNILKSCLLPGEGHGAISTPSEVLASLQAGSVPPTSIVNLVFVFAAHAPSVTTAHFDPHFSYDFLDLFTPISVSSESRARAFLWLCYHYLERPSPNPFATPDMPANSTLIPPLRTLTPEEEALENIDTPEEHSWGQLMRKQRQLFTEAHQNEERQALPKPRGAAARKKRKADATNPIETAMLASVAVPSMFVSRRPPFEQRAQRETFRPTEYRQPSVDPYEPHVRRSPERVYHPPMPDWHNSQLATPGQTDSLTRRASVYSTDLHMTSHTSLSNPYSTLSTAPDCGRGDGDPAPKRVRASHTMVAEHYQVRPYMQSHSIPRHEPDVRQYNTYSQYQSAPPMLYPSSYPHVHAPRPPAQDVDLFQLAWRKDKELDPLADDEGDTPEDRLAYEKRLRVLSRLRGKAPTPERDVHLPPLSSVLPGFI